MNDLVGSVLYGNNVVKLKNLVDHEIIVFDTSGLASDAVEYVC